MIAPFIYYALNLVLFIYTAGLSLSWAITGTPVPSYAYAVVFFAVMPLIIVPLFMRKLQRTYGFYVGTITLCATMILANLISVPYNAWNWVSLGVWTLLLCFYLWMTRIMTRARGMSRKQLSSLDSLTIVLRRD